jgi:putative hemolysin
MAVYVCLPLFGSPAHELEEGTAVKGRQLRTLAGELTERLQRAADLLDQLEAAGWSTQLAAFDVILTRPGVETREDALRQLRAAGLDSDQFMIVEEVEEDDLA